MSGRISARASQRRARQHAGESGCRTRIRTWARGFKVHCATTTQSGIRESAGGRTRTDTGVAPQQFLRLPRLPFRHSGQHATPLSTRATRPIQAHPQWCTAWPSDCTTHGHEEDRRGQSQRSCSGRRTNSSRGIVVQVSVLIPPSSDASERGSFAADIWSSAS